MLLDDLGSEKMTEYLQGILFEIIDRRWSNKVGGLIITANINIAGLSKIVGDRTASRIAGLVVHAACRAVNDALVAQFFERLPYVVAAGDISEVRR